MTALSHPAAPGPAGTPRPRTGRPTMAQVAEAAGVSPKTVSRVINGEPGVVATTAERVERAIAQLGYRHNHAAASLARGRTQDTVGLVIEGIAGRFYAELASGVEEVARAHGQQLLIASSEENPDRERETILALASRQVGGIIVVPRSGDHRYLRTELRSGLAVVFADRPPQRIKADYALVDNVAGAREGVTHLLRQGHRRIAFIGNELAVATSADRLEGYRQAHRDAGVDVDPALVVLGPTDVPSTEAALTRLATLPDPATAAFTQNSRLTMGAWRAIKQLDRPVALVGFDDFDLADVIDPPVTVVAQDPVELGRRAMHLLLRRIAHHNARHHHDILPTRLVVRGSGEIPPPRR
ncbi:LacI family DNA-binding transcriptional regulator [Phytohabitans sp. ZYX-F-186]|uniref:LacI family DNA-binding transcriptional regulator n=1 Tax=Phytohabitans maris TaxID=3071409 RepID=A0ABU0ZCI4_9ACTN|nr:LacI family DNA-binding transcriptional regulator [Phytohabitans sp. ZYX-F-186]MDQ7903637.1 LacI family DNA-binding transcriptional regulator [Phytohabitans sp. ZYX-F-186]